MYFTQNDPQILFPSWVAGLLVIWIAVLVGAIFWLRSLPPKNPARLAFRKRTSNGLLIIAGIGIVQFLARWLKIDVVEWRLWGYVLFVALIGYGLYSWQYARSTLPALVSQTGKVKSNYAKSRAAAAGSNAKAGADGVASEPAAPRLPKPIATTGRRDARRSKKRK